MFRYAATIFVSAFLLFQVQPMVARFILPWFGGSSLVWTTCMLFFQSALVCGYAYAHFVSNRLSPKWQWTLHTILLALAILTLPIQPTDYWKPLDSTMPTVRILALLAASVGLPFFLLSTTGPLIQAWQSKTHPDRSPFRLFALSNFASLLALLSYPFVFERFLTVEAQSWSWSLTFAVFAICAFLSGKLFFEQHGNSQAVSKEPLSERTNADEPADRVTLTRLLMWLVLPMLASVQLLATTNLMTQEVGSLPFLWILPLSLYLISFIICFDHQRWYWRPFFFVFFFASAVLASLVLEAGIDAPIVAQILGYSAVCFGASMCCHGELARSKPAPRHLTMFYLLISVGGALGGVFVAIIAPRIFIGYYEFLLGVLAAIVCCLFSYGSQVYRKENKESGDQKRSSWALSGFGLTLFLGLLVSFYVVAALGTQIAADQRKSILKKTRNEYGTLTVKELEFIRKLNNGQIEHGFQFKSPFDRDLLTAYYGPDSGLGHAINFLASDVDTLGLDIGAIGLGVGTICAWCEPYDTLRYFEINPAVKEFAEEYFWYLDQCKAAKTEIVLGDARLQLEREVENNDPRHYDVLIADAFSSDSIPIHLLTLESLQIYQQRIKPNGIIAFHVSNRFLYLENVVKVLAEELEMQAVLVDHRPSKEDDYQFNSSSWVLVTSNQKFVDHIDLMGLNGRWPAKKYTARWTDDFASIIPLLNWDDSNWIKELFQEKGWVKKKEKKQSKKQSSTDKVPNPKSFFDRLWRKSPPPASKESGG